MNIKWLCIIAGAMALLAIPPGWPYTYYQVLRWAISVSALIVTYGFYKSKLQGWALVFGCLAILFNPIFPIFMNKSTWAAIDLIVASLFFIAGFSYRISKKE